MPRSYRLPSTCLPFVLFLLLSAAALCLQHAMQDGPSERQPDKAILIPNGHSLRPFVLTQHTSAADLVFLQTVQYLGTPGYRQAGYPQLFELADLVTDLDPLYGYAYEVAGVALTDPAGRYEDSNRILEKGMTNVPNRWQLPFFAAFNRWYGQHDYAGAAPLLLAAARIPGSPAYLADLAARLYAEAGEIESGIHLIDAALRQELPQPVREDLSVRRKELIIEQELRRIDKAAAEFAYSEGRRPKSLDELIKAELLPPPPIPVEYNARTGEASSPLLPKRIRLFRADDQIIPFRPDR